MSSLRLLLSLSFFYGVCHDVQEMKKVEREHGLHAIYVYSSSSVTSALDEITASLTADKALFVPFLMYSQQLTAQVVVVIANDGM